MQTQVYFVDDTLLKALNLMLEPSVKISKTKIGSKHYQSRKWSPAEDKELIRVMEYDSTLTWPSVAEQIHEVTGYPLKSPQYVYQRWSRTLQAKPGDFTKEEKDQIYDLWSNGFTAAAIATYLQNRTDSQVSYQLKKLGCK